MFKHHIVKKLSPDIIDKKKIYLYSAGFNVDKKLKKTDRVDEEIDDLKMLVKKKVKIILISHQGNYKKKNTIHLGFLKNYLKKKLNTKIKYIRKKSLVYSKNLSKLIKPGEILFLPNTRFNKGEEKNSLDYGKKLSKLADIVVIGGFSKSHRYNSSNNAILKFIPGLLSNGIFKQLIKLESWTKIPKQSVCILGGEKKEKITIGLKNFVKHYSYILPTGVVLNTLLKSKGFEIGRSLHHEKNEIKLSKLILSNFKKKFLFPKTLLVYKSKKFNTLREIEITKVEKNDKIGGFLLSDDTKKILDLCVKKKGHILLAGTPSLMKYNINEPTNNILVYLKKNKDRSLLLGGDTISDINFKGQISTGGGSALYYLSKKVLPAVNTMYKNQKIFNVI